MTDTGPTVRPPRQRRSRESYERVMASARSLLSAGALEGVTIQEVAAHSEVSIGAIYERFGSKETLLRAVHADLMDQMAADECDAWRRVEPRLDSARGAIAAGVEIVIGVPHAHRALLRVFMHLGAVDDTVAALGSQTSRAAARRFTGVVLAHRSEIVHEHPERAVDIVFRMVYSTGARRVMYGGGFESEAELSWQEMTAELTRASTAYLLGA
jgi:AcrR family transcriptional regulator